MVRRRVIPFVSLATVVVACHTPQLSPAPPDSGGASERCGVRLSASFQWIGWPRDLEDVLTAAEVTIENRSGHAVAVTAADFALMAPAGERWPALTPSDALRITADFEGAKSPWFLHDRSSFIPAAPPPGPNPPPSEPEVLPDGGATTAQLFFGVPARRLKRVEIVATIVTAAGKHIGDVRLPFVRR